MTGIITARGPAIMHRGAVVPLPAERTPLGAWVAAAVAAIDAGELLPCPNCGRYACECWEWAEMMAAPRPLDEMTDEELPF